MMKLDPAIREFEVVESEVIALHQSRIAVNIALEGERSQNCEAFVCGGKSGADYWVAAGVYLNIGRRTLVYRHGPIGKDKAAFDAAVQEALNFLIPLGFELDSVNLKYSQAMRQVILKGIRGIGFAGKAGAKKQPPLETRRTAAKGKTEAEVAEEQVVAAPIDAVEKKVEPTAAVAPAAAPVVAAPAVTTAPAPPPPPPAPEPEPKVSEPVTAAAAASTPAPDAGALQRAQQEKAAAELAVAAAEKKYQAEIAGLQKELAAREASFADLREQLVAQEEQLAEALAAQGEVEAQRTTGKKKEADLNGIVNGLKAELKALRDETQKALKQAAVAEAAVQEARVETATAQTDRDAYKEAAEKERVSANATRERLTAELAKEKAASEKLTGELTQFKADAAKQDAESRSQLAKIEAELEQVRQESAELQKKFEKARQEREDARAEGREAQAELEQVRDELTALQDDVAKIVADQEGQRRKLSDRARLAEAEVDRLMQSLVDTESAWSVRLHALEEVTAERVAVLKGVVEQLWPVAGGAVPGEASSPDLARIAAAPLKLSAGAPLTVPAREATVAQKPVQAVPLPKIPIVPDFEEIEAAVAASRARQLEEVAVEDLVEEEVVAEALLAEEVVEDEAVEDEVVEDAPPAVAVSQQARFFDADFLASSGAETEGKREGGKEHVAISFDDEDWGDLDLSGGGSDGEPVDFRHNQSLAKWMIDLAKVKELHTSVNVQQIAPPGGGPGTFQAFVCRAEKEQGEDACYVILEQTDGAKKKLVYEPGQDAAMGKLVQDALFFVESIGFMMLGVDLKQDTDKRGPALAKCRSFIRS